MGSASRSRPISSRSRKPAVTRTLEAEGQHDVAGGEHLALLVERLVQRAEVLGARGLREQAQPRLHVGLGASGQLRQQGQAVERERRGVPDRDLATVPGVEQVTPGGGRLGERLGVVEDAHGVHHHVGAQAVGLAVGREYLGDVGHGGLVDPLPQAGLGALGEGVGVYDALYHRTDAVRHVLGRDERHAAAMADALHRAKSTQTPLYLDIPVSDLMTETPPVAPWQAALSGGTRRPVY